MVKNPPANAGDTGFILCQGIKILQDVWCNQNTVFFLLSLVIFFVLKSTLSYINKAILGKDDSNGI